MPSTDAPRGRTHRSWYIGWGCDHCDFETVFTYWPWRWVGVLQMKIHEWWRH